MILLVLFIIESVMVFMFEVTVEFMVGVVMMVLGFLPFMSTLLVLGWWWLWV